MVPEKTVRKNFIERNIDACTNKINPSYNFGIKGYPVCLFDQEEKYRKKNCKKQEWPTKLPPKYYIYPQDRFTTNTETRGTWKKGLKVRKSRRATLNLPVKSIQVPESDTPEKIFARKLFYQIAGHTINRRDSSGLQQWEALHCYTTFQRLLAAMNSSGQTIQCSANALSNTYQTSVSSLTKEENFQTKKSEHSYQEILKRHVDTLNNVVTQEQEGEKKEKIIKKTKKKALPKLEIKITGLNEDVNSLEQNLQELALTEELDNFGNLTPVITFNHVLSFNTANEFQYSRAVSPGTSSKGSRSPSPLLEVPTPSSEISTKFPTV